MTTPTLSDPPMRARLSLVGLDGNAFAVIGAVVQQLRRQGAPPEVLSQFRAEAMSGDYDQLLQAAIRWTVEPDDDDGLVMEHFRS